VSADVITWLRSDEGEQWSRAFHAGSPPVAWMPPPVAQWRTTGPLDQTADPAGAPPLATASATGEDQ
jgi:hypothetical protein